MSNNAALDGLPQSNM